MKQIDRAALERANERRRAIGASRERRTGFAEEYMSGKIGKRDSGADIAVGIKERFAKGTEPKSAAKTRCITIAVHDALNTFSGYWLSNRFFHLRKDEPT